MSSVFEITGQDIAKLNDDALRNLIGLLCEADYRRAGRSTAGITWGGHQDAPDGGFDVVVDTGGPPPSNSFVVRPKTGFQVRKPNMTVGKITPEMRPKGILRPSIMTLIQHSGSYVIVSSAASTSACELTKRKEAMQAAVRKEPGNERLHLDFFDQGRVASWVRTHPSKILWVREQLGSRLSGWRPYGNWANTPQGAQDDYLLDDCARLHDGTKDHGAGLSAEDGLLLLRSILSSPRASVRLAGLSGVGKTRFVQALFDHRIAKDELNPDHAFYTDVSYEPDPHPRAFAEHLVALGERAVLVVDNCPPALHRILAATCAGPGSLISLLTVEYDVQDDLPDETTAFRLEPAGEDLISELVRRRFPDVGQVDAQTIGTFSGGNARIAIALANTLRQGQTLSGLRDTDLFERLFEQRRGSNSSLFSSAQACSLVYSFDGEDIEEETELHLLASLLGKSVGELYRDLAELKSRGLAQSRGVWRAVLPPAIANRLASRALETFPKSAVSSAFLQSRSTRLIVSFTRRLSYLHDCEPAVEISADWMGNGGWLSDVSSLNEFGIAVFRNLAPVVPDKALEAIIHAASVSPASWFSPAENLRFKEFVSVLRFLAYDCERFHRATMLLCDFALAERNHGSGTYAQDVLCSLFHLYLSGTLARPEQRLAVIEDLVNSGDAERRSLAMSMLDATLEAWHFTSLGGFDFGARPRTFGYIPNSRADIVRWYQMFIHACTHFALNSQNMAEGAREVLARNFRGLWTKAQMFTDLEAAARALRPTYSWNEGWVAIRQTLSFDRDDIDARTRTRLLRLEELTRPQDLVERARTYALTRGGSFAWIEDPAHDGTSAWDIARAVTKEIGREAAQDRDALDVLLPELVSTHGERLGDFGEGLGDGSSSRPELWTRLYNQFRHTPHEQRNPAVLLGFIVGCSRVDSDFTTSVLDQLIDDPILAEKFPQFQIAVGVDARGLGRLRRCLDSNTAPVSAFSLLAYGQNHRSISDEDLANLLVSIASKVDGVGVAVDILRMRFYPSGDSRARPECLLRCGRQLLSSYDFRHSRLHDDHRLSTIVKICCANKAGAPAAKFLCERFALAISRRDIYGYDYPRTLRTVACLHPFTLLDVLFGGHSAVGVKRTLVLDTEDHKANPLNEISDDDIILWCDQEPVTRYPAIIGAIDVFARNNESHRLGWKQVTYHVLEKAPDVGRVLQQLRHTIYPSSWNGSRSVVLEGRYNLLRELFNHENADISSWARNDYVNLQTAISAEKAHEERHDRRRFLRFE